MSVNRRIVLAARPDGFPVESDFQLVESEVAEIQEGEFLVQAIYPLCLLNPPVNQLSIVN